MGNFNFLLPQNDYKEFARACVEAENQMLVSTVSTSIMTRRALELAVKWMYKYDRDLNIPYRDNLSSLVNDYTFQDIVSKEVRQSIIFIIKNGNLAAHDSKTISKGQAMTALRNLFEFIQWLDYSYGYQYEERSFDEDLVPNIEKLKLKLKPKETEKVLSTVDNDQDKPLVLQKAEADPQQQKELTEQREHADEAHGQAFKLDSYTEEITRKEFINVDLALAGWSIGQNVEEEVELKELPNQSGKGYADYVLYGRDGLPLAVVEAKKTENDPNRGEHQATLYAEALERTYQRRPFIFTTNGFNMWFTDDVSRRRVSGFYNQDDLQRLMDRRRLKKPIKNMPLNPDIAGRPYQRSAILNTLESFSKNKREVLLVMATGTGKTRTSVSIVDILTRANWAKNILFLADRTALVKQAMRSFNSLLPELTVANLTDRVREDNDPSSARMIFSTYPTMMNAIDTMIDEEIGRLFSVGHFDLIIIDEAHRSIYKKYQAIFDYFDAMVLGLTATPREDIDRNTYEMFHLEHGVPTFAYDLEEAVNEGFLVDYKTIEADLKFPTDGIKYDDLSLEEQESYEVEFGEDFEGDIGSSAINTWVFNADTIDKVIHHFMDEGIKDSSGNEIGKTIVFAQNQRHADVIKERFDLLYPEKGPAYAAVVTHAVTYAQDLIDRFSVKGKLPRIAISVNMLDTGIDVPEVVNLVFFKKVRSKTMFWQMIGRGTRLCEDLFGPGLDKKYFLIFDYGANFEYFRVEKKPISARSLKSLTERIFVIQVQIIRELSSLDYQNDDKYVTFRQKLLDHVLAQVQALDESNFRVRQHLKFVRKYKDEKNWQALSLIALSELEEHIAPLLYAGDDAEITQRFDLYMFVIELASLLNTIDNRAIKSVVTIAKHLEKLGNIPQVKEKSETIKLVQKEQFWKDASALDIEKVRQELRDLVQLITPDEQKIFYVNFEDEFLDEREGKPQIYNPVDLSNYKEKVEAYIRNKSNNPVIAKLYNNEKIKQEDLTSLEKVLFEELGTEDDYKSFFGDKAITKLIREINGLDKAAVQSAFASFMDTYNLNRDQTEFLRVLMLYLETNGYMELSQFQEEPFKSIGSISLVFDQNMKQLKDLIAIVNEINKNLLAA